MADAIVSVVLEQLISIIGKETNQQVRLVVGVRKEIAKLTSNFRAIQAVLLDAERRGLKEMAARYWLDKLKNASYDMDDVLDEWNTAILKLQGERVESALVHKKKVCLFFPSPGFCFKQVGLRRDIALKIKEINENIASIAREKHMFNIDTSKSIDEPQRLKTTHFVDVSEIRGRDDEKNSLLSKLLSDSHVEKKGLHIISIVGMGGIGKTTLAQLVYNDGEVKSNFDKTIWVCVSDPFDEVRIAKAIIEGLTDSVSNFTELESLLKLIHESVSKTKFLLVLDDVWTEEYNKWEPLYNALNNGLHGSKILVTTRKSTVARKMKSIDIDIINIEELSKDESWLLFTQLAFFDRPQQECEKLEKIGREIVGKCRGLPLAVKTIGSLLRFKRTEQQWQRVLDSETWKLEALEDVFRPLLLSYNDLPPMIKLCFSYCAVFPKDYKMEKDELIKLWMAQGYLGLKQNQELEIVGEEYFDRLALCSFFQDFEKDDDDNIITCKMHDIVHEFAQFLVKNECSMMVTSSDEESSLSCFYENARHSKLILDDEGASFPSNKGSIFKLRSLFVRWKPDDSSSISNCLPSLFKRLPCLRALELHEDWGRQVDLITKIPSEIGKLIHLRYLNMSSLTGIKELPESLCELYNLQTLNLSSCYELEKLPEGMGKLINLRHLMINDETNALSYMPKGIERLVCLRTLSKLVVGGDGHNSQVCSLDCLKKLDYLRGSLVIRGLGNVIDGAEAKNANLRSKKYLLDLKLYFDYRSEASSTEVSTKDEAVLEALHPTPNLEKLFLTGYRGMSFDWMAPLTQLSKLTLEDCINCEHLPPLGKLPLLETLQIRGMSGLKRVGNEFLGIKNKETSSSSSLILFPKLKSLNFSNLENWEDWEYEITEDIAIMPCLSYCEIDHCPKLKALPNHFLQATSLKTLDISDCPVLKQWAEDEDEALSTEVCRKDESVVEALHAPPNLEKLVLRWYRGITMPFDWMGLFTQLRKLTLEDCINCEHLPPLGKLPLLQTLEIEEMRGLKRVGNEFLGIKNNDSSSSSSSLIFFPKLESLVFFKLENWEDWEYEITEDIAIMPCLSYCDIACCPKLKALPNHFLQATSLKKLYFNDNGLVLPKLATENLRRLETESRRLQTESRRLKTNHRFLKSENRRLETESRLLKSENRLLVSRLGIK